MAENNGKDDEKTVRQTSTWTSSRQSGHLKKQLKFTEKFETSSAEVDSKRRNGYQVEII